MFATSNKNSFFLFSTKTKNSNKVKTNKILSKQEQKTILENQLKVYQQKLQTAGSQKE